MNKQEFKALSGLVRQGKLRASVAFLGYHDVIAVGRYHNSWPPALPNRVLAAHIRAMKLPYTLAYRGIMPPPMFAKCEFRNCWQQHSNYLFFDQRHPVR